MRVSSYGVFAFLLGAFFCNNVLAGGIPFFNPEEGWVEVSSGYWQRTGEEGSIEAVAVGPEGLKAVLSDLNEQMVDLVRIYLRNPSDEILKALNIQSEIIYSIEQGIASTSDEAEEGPFTPKDPVYCDPYWSASAAGGECYVNRASATSEYYGSSPEDCEGLCDFHSYVYVERLDSGGELRYTSDSCDKYEDFNVTCHSYKYLHGQGDTSCYARAYASMYCAGSEVFRWVSDTSYSCGYGPGPGGIC